MDQPYRMVVVNLAASFLLGLFFLTYTFLFPKKKVSPLVALVLISLLPIISIFRKGVYESGDFTIHIYRAMAFFDSLKSGNIMPSWAGMLNATYGYPLFIFNYSLPYYLISIIHSVGMSFVASMKFFLALNFILSGIFMYLFSVRFFKKELPAFTASIFYLFAPYHLIDMHFKVTIGEIVFITFLPLVFLAFFKLFANKPRYFDILLFGTYFSFLMLSHIVLAFFVGCIFLSYFVVKKSKKVFILVFSGFLLSFLQSVYMWLGPLILSKYTITQKTVLLITRFPPFESLFYSPWRFGFLFQGPRGEISNLIGYTQLFVVMFTLIMLFKNTIPKNFRPNISFFLCIIIVLLLLLTPASAFLWNLIPFLRVTDQQRVLLLISFCTSILAGYFALLAKKKSFVYVLIFITIFYTILNWGQRRMIPNITDKNLLANLPYSTFLGEGHFYAAPFWVNPNKPWTNEIPKEPIQVLTGDMKYRLVKRSSNLHEYYVRAYSNSEVLENSLYFPFWQASIDGKKVQISPDKRGIILLKLPSGEYKLTLKFVDSPFYMTLKAISFLLLIFSIILIVYFY